MNTTNLPMAAAAPNTEESPRINPFVIRMNEYNDRSLARSEKLPYMKYFIEARRACFPHIKFNFMSYFLLLTTQRLLFCVPHEKLREYGVINDNRSNNVLACLKQYGLIENEDFTVLNVQQRTGRGGSNKKTYMLTQDAFKLCLMRAKNSREFANYYLMLEKVIGFQQKYLDMYNERMMNFKNDQIERLERMMNEQTERINELTEITRGAREEASGAREEAAANRQETQLARQETQLTREENAGLRDDVQDLLDEISGVRVELREVREQNETIQHTVDLIVEDRNVRPENPVLGHEFLLTKLDDHDLV